jgi:hypothetical protein
MNVPMSNIFAVEESSCRKNLLDDQSSCLLCETYIGDQRIKQAAT